MSSSRLLWIGPTGSVADEYRAGLKAGLDQVEVTVVDSGIAGLAMLAQDPARRLIVIVEQQPSDMDPATLVTGIRQVNPAIEIILLGEHDLGWRNLSLPKYYRPILLTQPCALDTLISCVAKLQESVEAKEHLDQLSRGIGENVGMSRTSTEALLRLLNRQNSVGMIAMRRDGFFSLYNAEAERLTGISIEDAAHIQVWSQMLLTDPDSARTLLGAIELFWGQKIGRENMRLRITRPDGRTLTLSVTVIVLLDNLGHPRQMASLFFDPFESCIPREYDLLIESEACGFYTYLPRVGFLRASGKAARLIGRLCGLDLKPADVLFKKIGDLGLSEDIAAEWTGFLESAAKGAAPDSESCKTISDRIPRHIVTAPVLASKDRGQAVFCVMCPEAEGLSGLFQGFADRDLAQETLDVLPRPFLYVRTVRDSEGRPVDFVCGRMNAGGVNLLKPPFGELDGIPLADLFPDPEAYEIIREKVTTVVERGGYIWFECLVRPENRKAPGTLLRSWVGKVGDGASLFMRDITAAREEEHHLKQYWHIFSHMEEAIIVTDLAGNVIDWNPASERMFGYTKDQIVGKPAAILTQNKRGDQLEQTREVLRDGDVWKGEYEYIRGDGSKGIAFSVFALLRDELGNSYGAVGLSHDLTERKRLEEGLTIKSRELQEKNMALNTLLRHAEEERMRACEQIAADLTRRVTQTVFRILDAKHRPESVESNARLLLEELGAGVPHREKEPVAEDPALKLSEKELEVARLIRLGKTTDEIAFVLEKSVDTIRLQRISIRKKLGLDRKDRNLAARLRKMDLG